MGPKLPAPTVVEHHTPKDRVTIRLRVRRKREGGSELVAVRRFVVICVRVPQVAGVPPLLGMDSAQFAKEGAALELWPGDVVELVGEIPILGSAELFRGALGWGILNIIPELVPMTAFAIEAITIDGHPLPDMAPAP